LLKLLRLIYGHWSDKIDYYCNQAIIVASNRIAWQSSKRMILFSTTLPDILKPGNEFYSLVQKMGDPLD
jgi:hypothetical protein